MTVYNKEYQKQVTVAKTMVAKFIKEKNPSLDEIPLSFHNWLMMEEMKF